MQKMMDNRSSSAILSMPCLLESFGVPASLYVWGARGQGNSRPRVQECNGQQACPWATSTCTVEP